MTDDHIEIVRVYAHSSNDDESATELAEAFADEPEGFHSGSFYSTLRGLAYEIACYYEIDSEAETATLIGVKETGRDSVELGRCPEPTWDYSWNDTPDTNTDDDPSPHITVGVTTLDGEQRNALACEIAEQDIADNGRVSFPLSGECTCFDNTTDHD